MSWRLSSIAPGYGLAYGSDVGGAKRSLRRVPTKTTAEPCLTGQGALSWNDRCRFCETQSGLRGSRQSSNFAHTLVTRPKRSQTRLERVSISSASGQKAGQNQSNVYSRSNDTLAVGQPMSCRNRETRLG